MDKRIIPNEILFTEVDAILREGREAVITPTGNSMLPFIRGGVDRVVLKRREEACVGDIVLVRTGGRYILHRVVDADGSALTLMGDGNIRGQERCSTADLIGTVTEVIRPSGRHITPGKARLWRALRPARRYLLAIYRRLF